MAVTDYERARDLIIGEVTKALAGVDPGECAAAVEALCSAGRVFVVGVGRVMLALQAFAKRLNHLGIPACHVGAIEEPAITSRDLLVVGSGSGESIVPVAVARKARSLGARILYLGSNMESAIAGIAELRVRIPCATKLHRPGETPSAQPLTSLFEQALLLLCDALCLQVINRRGIDPSSLPGAHANLE
jgi:6-phospho-3-hexuloisomerase